MAKDAPEGPADPAIQIYPAGRESRSSHIDGEGGHAVLRGIRSARARLLKNVDDPARFIHEIEYESHEVIELNRQRVASDPRVQAYLQTWRSLFPGGVEIDVYQESMNVTALRAGRRRRFDLGWPFRLDTARRARSSRGVSRPAVCRRRFGPDLSVPVSPGTEEGAILPSHTR